MTVADGEEVTKIEMIWLRIAFYPLSYNLERPNEYDATSATMHLFSKVHKHNLGSWQFRQAKPK